MAVREKGEASITVDGTVYTGRPSYLAVARLEDLIDDSFETSVMKNFLKGRRMALIYTVWVILQDCHGTEIKTIDDAARFIERAGEVEAMDFARRVMELNAPPKEDEPESQGTANPTEPAATTPDGEAQSLQPVESV